MVMTMCVFSIVCIIKINQPDPEVNYKFKLNNENENCVNLEIQYLKHGRQLTLHFSDIQNISIMKLTPDMFNLGLSTEKSIQKLASQMLFQDDDTSSNIKTTRMFKKTSVVKPVVNSNLTDCVFINDTIVEESE